MKKFIKIFSVICFLSLLTPNLSFGAEMFFETQKDSFAKNEEFVVRVILDTENISVNAIEGNLVFPTDLLEIKEIKDGNSAINFWVEKPYINSQNTLFFSGIVAGGLVGSQKFLFSITFVPKAIGKGVVTLNQIQVLENDGLGTKIKTTVKPFSFSVNSEAATGSKEGDIKDNDSPENFLPIIGKDPSILDGQYFVVFSTQDKGVGIDHYEVREGFWSKYKTATSPYVLEDQFLKKTLYIKAVDKSGNTRVVTVAPQNPPKWYQDYFIISIIILLVGWLFFSKKHAKN